MATIAQVRILLGDLPQFERQTATGDGASTQFVLTKYPVIAGSDAATVDGTAATYTLNVETGLLTFSTAPGSGDAVAITYTHAEISDESITAILALEPDVYGAAALAAESIAGRYASSVDQKIGDLSTSDSQLAKQWADKAKSLRAADRNRLFEPFAGGITISGKTTYTDNPDIVQPTFTRTLHDYEEAEA